jgi:glycerol-3-phosphate dehydrogenase
VPSFKWWEKYYYGIGLGLYDLLAGKLQIGRVKMLSKKRVMMQIPMVNTKGLSGGISYMDGQFDDARLAINLAQTAAEQGACIVNHMEVDSLVLDNKKVKGAELYDHINEEDITVRAKVVINATGVFADDIIRMENPDAPPLLSPSQGVHIVVDSHFFPGNTALMIPKTDDDRVLFAVPWHDKVVLGTTDTAVDEVTDEPRALEEEISFIITHFNRYTTAKITHSDVLSVFAGLRPLVKQVNAASTALISREHTIVVPASGLITIIGGKWTTYRKMAMDAIRNAIFVGKLDKKECITDKLKIHGWTDKVNEADPLHIYGADAVSIRQMMTEDQRLAEPIHELTLYSKAEVLWVIRNEMAMTVEDVLARRLRLLFLDARAAIEVAPQVAWLMAQELGRDEEWVVEQIRDFTKVAKGYLISQSEDPKD